MVKVGIVTINDNNNYGNRLQNYATQKILEKMDVEASTIINNVTLNKKEDKKIKYFIRIVKYKLDKLKYKIKDKKNYNKRETLFYNFNKNIKFTKKVFNYFDLNNISDFKYMIVGSDQVWNPYFSRLREFDLLDISDTMKKISFSASFGISELPQIYNEKTSKALKSFKAISVREEAGKEIVENLTGRSDIEVLIDPTMLLTAEEWDNVLSKPEQLKTDKYILNYFLGEISEKKKEEINKIARENKCEIINILDKKSPFYETGPSEFLYLEKNAFLICTDSFHSSVFAILYNKPFIVFDREDKIINMNSRIDTLINKFDLKNRKFDEKIKKENLYHDYTETYKILEKEREKAIKFLKKALDLEN